MAWLPENLYKLKQIQGYPFKLDETITVTNKRCSSWTTNSTVVSGFIDEKKLWIVVEATIQPSAVAVDTRLIPKKIRDTLYRAFQREIILKPGKYKVKVVEIGASGKKLQQGFEGYDPTMFETIEENFRAFAQRFIKENQGLKVKYITKNQTIFTDWAVEVPLLQIKAWKENYGVAEIRYKDGIFELRCNNWGKARRGKMFDELKFGDAQELIKALQDYTPIANFIRTCF